VDDQLSFTDKKIIKLIVSEEAKARVN
jgi:hypothetical protein